MDGVGKERGDFSLLLRLLKSLAWTLGCWSGHLLKWGTQKEKQNLSLRSGIQFGTG